ncbi:MAG: carbohydrate-binding domain-containing protein [Eubacterium sp.]|nr:carbohydrate-binding domain-containing protein [Eubacterium sp.]
MKNNTYKAILATLLLTTLSTSLVSCGLSNALNTELTSSVSSTSSGTLDVKTTNAAVFTHDGEASVTLTSAAALSAADAAAVKTAVTADMITIKDDDVYTNWTSGSYTSIALSNDSVSVNGDGVTYEGTKITITSGGTYVFTGTLTDGSITVSTQKTEDVRIILNGVDITCSDGPVINVAEADKVTISLEKGTENSLSDAETHNNEELDAVIYSASDLVLNGEGSLTINAAFKDAVHSKDDLRILGGSYDITAADDGFVGKDALEVTDGNFNLNTQGDAFKSTNDEDENRGFIYITDGSFNVTSGDEAFQAVNQIQVENGEFNISAEGKGISAGSVLLFNNGSINVYKSYEALEAPCIFINDGTFDLKASDDGINTAGGEMDATSEENGRFSQPPSGDFKPEDGDFQKPDRDFKPEDGEFEKPSGDTDAASENSSTENAEDNDKSQKPQRPDKETSNDDASQAEENANHENSENSEKPQFPDGGNFGGGMMETSSGYLFINGGTILISADGDGLDSNTCITQTGGDIIVEGPTNDGNGSLDYLGTYIMTGGSLLALGSSGMLQSISDSDQTTVHDLTVIFSEKQKAGTDFAITDESGKELISYTSTKEFSSAVYASASLEDHKSYNIQINGKTTGTATLSGIVTTVDETGAATQSRGGMGGNPPQMTDQSREKNTDEKSDQKQTEDTDI